MKICGVTRPEDIEAAEGADYVGFVVESDSPRALPLSKARDLMSVCDVGRVAVSALADVPGLAKVARTLEPEALQAHAPLSAKDLRVLADECQCEVWALVLIGDGRELPRAEELSRVADAVVLDTRGERLGGTGRPHDWTLSAIISEKLRPHPVVLAGGLSPSNVKEAIAKVRPWAVDVSSGVEVEGRKDADLVKRFIGIAREAAE